MTMKPLEAKVRTSGGSSTNLLIKARDVVIETDFAELASCEFPIWASASIPVEIPTDGTKSYVVGPFTGSVTPRGSDGSFPNIIKFPVYKEQGFATAAAFDELPCDGPSQILTKVPLAAVATMVSGQAGGKLIQTHCVLPFWNDGTAVLVRLDWFEGEPSEGAPNPEWHMKASSGLPAALGLEQLVKASRLPESARRCRYRIHLTPWLLGAKLLEDDGQETPHQIWQREWRFEDGEAFSKALSRVTRGLLDTGGAGLGAPA